MAEFTEQGITGLHAFADSSFDVTISSEVLEHIKEYHLEDRALKELWRVTRKNGIILIGTPNSELLSGHGFSFEEIRSLFASNFDRFCIFENALVPFGEQKLTWQKRLAASRTGVIVTERINLDETVLPANVKAEMKTGLEPGFYRFQDIDIDTTLLHNTHSWVIIAIK